MNPKYPVYIVSKGRWESLITARSLEKIDVPYYIIVEKQEYRKYKKHMKDMSLGKILILPQNYLEEYDVFNDEIGKGNGPGPGAARNFCWDHSIQEIKAHQHWVLDDNINGFIRFNRNRKVPVADGTILRCAEDFVDRYENVALSGLNYRFFAEQRAYQPPFRINRRIYSCLLIRNDIPYRWRGRYNEDTDLSLRVLKDEWCTILFQAFLCNKIATQVVKGGNTGVFYAKEGTYNKSLMLCEMHPDVSRLVKKYGRWHHYVDYRRFRHNKLQKKKGISIPKGIDNYGMQLIPTKENFIENYKENEVNKRTRKRKSRISSTGSN